jgi:membrane-associated protease RseP (regulator of RpoE activity)
MNSEKKRVVFQVFLFLTTFATTSLAGSAWCYGKMLSPDYTWNDFRLGMNFSVPLLLFLTVHEFGHYFMALFHRVKTSLPYYIPVPPVSVLALSIGTLGAVIRQRSRPYSNQQHFDIGIAGPLAGFVVGVGILIYGFATLPPPEYIFEIHPEYKQYGLNYAEHVYQPEYFKKDGGIDVQIGGNILYHLLEKIVADPARVPNAHEIMHYPALFAGFLALFFTCLNLLPVGQLDGGHVVYGLFGHRIHRIIATVAFLALLLYAGLGNELIDLRQGGDSALFTIPLYVFILYLSLMGLKRSKRDTFMYAMLIFALHFALATYMPTVHGYSGWMLFAVLIGRFIGIQHPPSEIEMPLDSKRVVLGWIALLIFVLCFSPVPVDAVINPPQ